MKVLFINLKRNIIQIMMQEQQIFLMEVFASGKESKVLIHLPVYFLVMDMLCLL